MIASLLTPAGCIENLAGQIDLKLSVLNLVDLIESIRETTLPQISAHQAHLHFEVLESDLYCRGRLVADDSDSR